MIANIVDNVLYSNFYKI